MPSQFINQISSSLDAIGDKQHINEFVAASNTVNSLSGHEFKQQSLKLASALLTESASNHFIIVCLEAGLDCLRALIAGFFAGKTIIPCAIPQRAADIQRLQQIIADSQCQNILIQSKDQVLFESHFPQSNLLTIESLNEQAQPAAPLVDFPKPKDDYVLIQYSSGSTHSPKGVCLTGEMILANWAVIAKEWQFTKQDRFMTWLPYYHDMGLFGTIIYPLLTSAWVLVMESQEFIKRPSRWLRLISEYKITVSGAPPFAYELCVKYIKEKQKAALDLSTWRIAFCGADYLPQQLQQQFITAFASANFQATSFVSCYGLAENVLFVAGRKPTENEVAHLLEQPETSQFSKASHEASNSTSQSASYNTRLSPCFLGQTKSQIRIISPETGIAVREGEVGEICVTGDSNAKRYLHADVPSVQVENQYWVRTGDLAYIQANKLYVVARLKDIVKVHGKHVYPIDLAVFAQNMFSELNQHAFLMKEYPDEGKIEFAIEHSQRICSEDADSMEKALQEAFVETFGVYVHKVCVCSRYTLERTTSGKIQRWKSS